MESRYVQLFYESKTNKRHLFKDAYYEDPLTTLRILFLNLKREYSLLTSLFFIDRQSFLLNMDNVAKYCSWKVWRNVLRGLIPEDMKITILKYIGDTLTKDLAALAKGEDISMCAKWAPSEKKKLDKSSFKILVKIMNCNPESYRKVYISPLRKALSLVEEDIRQQKWSSISYHSVPKDAFRRYYNLFLERDTERFVSYLNFHRDIQKHDRNLTLDTIRNDSTRFADIKVGSNFMLSFSSPHVENDKNNSSNEQQPLEVTSTLPVV